MMLLRKNAKEVRDRESGQSLLETAVAIPMLLVIAFNIINVAYCWFMVLTLCTTPRHAVEYSTQGGYAAFCSGCTTPSSTKIKAIATDNFTGSVAGTTSSSVTVRVCAYQKGDDKTTGIGSCSSDGSFGTPAADPEAGVFVLNRVDVSYTVTPIIPGTVFGVLLPSNLTFHRQVSMRSLF